MCTFSCLNILGVVTDYFYPYYDSTFFNTNKIDLVLCMYGDMAEVLDSILYGGTRKIIRVTVDWSRTPASL